MTDRDALYAAILAHPDEDTPRLVFADWLEENGDEAHAAFIRKQIELAKVPEWDPLWVRTKYFDPDAISGEGHPLPELQAPLSWGCRPSRSTFHRGLPAVLGAFRGIPLTEELKTLLKIAPVDQITWYANGPNDRTLPHWASLIRDPVFARIHSLMPALAHLSDANIRELHDSPHAANLTELELTTCSLSRDQAIAFLGLPRFRQLQRLGLRIVNEGVGDVAKAAAAFREHNLKYLHLSWGSTLERSWLLWNDDFLAAPLLCGLQDLNLSEHPIGPEDARALVRSPALVGLESLRLRNCRGGDELALALAACSGLANLRQLDLQENGIGPKGARAIAESPHLANLRVLNLCDNPVGDDGAIALFKSPHLANVLDLNLLFGEVSDTGARIILDSPLVDSLVHLELHMMTMRMVKGNSPITEPMAHQLRERFGGRLVLDAVSPPLA